MCLKRNQLLPLCSHSRLSSHSSSQAPQAVLHTAPLSEKKNPCPNPFTSHPTTCTLLGSCPVCHRQPRPAQKRSGTLQLCLSHNIGVLWGLHLWGAGLKRVPAHHREHHQSLKRSVKRWLGPWQGVRWNTDVPMGSTCPLAKGHEETSMAGRCSWHYADALLCALYDICAEP